MVAFSQDIIKNRVITYHRGKSIGVFVALEYYHIVSFKTFGFMNSQEFNFSVSN